MGRALKIQKYGTAQGITINSDGTINQPAAAVVVDQGYPNFGGDKSIEVCYHIVRNSDLLESYDPERCIGYHVRCGGNRTDGIIRMFEIFENRIMRLIENGYINLEPAKEYALDLHIKAVRELKLYKEVLS